METGRIMIAMMMIVIIMMVTMTVRADAAFDSYQGKYRRLNTWNIFIYMQKFVRLDGKIQGLALQVWPGRG